MSSDHVDFRYEETVSRNSALYHSIPGDNSESMNPEICPNCGAEVPARAKACPECGSDPETGWSDEARYEGLGIDTEANFDYDEFVRREFAGEKPKRRNGLLWFVTAIIVILGFVLLWVKR